MTRGLSLSKYLCSKKNYSMKTPMSSQEFSLSGRTNIHHICINLLVPRYTKTNIGNPGNQQN